MLMVMIYHFKTKNNGRRGIDTEERYLSGCYILAALIHNLRKDGYVINTEKATKVSRITGKKAHFANYNLQ